MVPGCSTTNSRPSPGGDVTNTAEFGTFATCRIVTVDPAVTVHASASGASIGGGGSPGATGASSNAGFFASCLHPAAASASPTTTMRTPIVIIILARRDREHRVHAVLVKIGVPHARTVREIVAGDMSWLAQREVLLE